MIWQDLLNQIANLQREAAGDAPLTSRVAGKLGMPYFLQADIEDILLQVSQEMIREISPRDLLAMGSYAVSPLISSVTGSATVPVNCVGTLDISVDNGPTDEILLAGFYQRRNITENGTPLYAFGGVSGVGKIFYCGGTTLSALFLVEPPLADWQADHPILPPGTDAERIARTFERMQVIT